MKLHEIQVDKCLVNKCFEVVDYMYSHKYIVSDDKEIINEQNYMLSFTYLFGCLVGDKELLVGGELKKSIQFYDNDIAKELHDRIRSKTNTRESVMVKPDFVIHNDIIRGKLNPENQKVIVEAKTAKNIEKDEFCWDLFKLREYIDQLGFNYAIYLIINNDKEFVESKLDNYKEMALPEITSEISEKLLFILQEKEETAPKLYKIIPKITIEKETLVR